MKSSLKWMQDYVHVDMTQDPQKFADTLTIAGIPVEQVEYWGDEIKKVITGKILKIDKHPDADKLVICQIDTGDEQLQIVTGASNVREGQIVPVAVHGAHLPGGVKIKKSKLRGVPSNGMLCSAHELGFDDSVLLPEEREGIWILPADTPVGVDAADYLDARDVVYEYELTPNRGDCFSMVGLSREFAALSGQQAAYPDITVDECGESISGKVKVSIEDEELCSRYTARLLVNVTIGKSPLWMQQRLRKSGIRPINNVVDVTNYVMIELGIPLHAYDYDKVEGHHLIARRAKEGEGITTLDDVKRTLTKDMLVIADAKTPCCIAGIMGGMNSEVTVNTHTVILECASFKGSNIRHTGRSLGLRSEASGRFERGLDAESCIHSLDRCAQLLQQMDACEVAQGIVDVYPHPQETTTISFTAAQINAFLGTEIAEADMVSLLQTLQFQIKKDGDVLTAVVPSYRGDCTEMPDIAEEVARIYGYENIPSTRPWSNISKGEAGYRHEIGERISAILSSGGLNETVTFSFMNTDSLKKLLFPETDPLYKAVPILNPITEEFPLMRTTLIPSLMDALVRNQAVKNPSVGMYEIAPVYFPKALPITELPDQEYHVAGLLYGRRTAGQWPASSENYDFYDVKGLVEAVLDGLGIQADLEASAYAPLHPGKAAQYVKNGEVLCQFGEIHPEVIDNYDIAGPVYVFEMNLKHILPLVNLIPDYHKVAKFPAISRDLAFLAPVQTQNADIVAVLREDGGKYLEAVHLFDMYQGKQVPRGFKSLAYSLLFRSDEGTLTDGDIEESINMIIKDLKDKLDCELR
jgi:phenylalanyl-tRNA synthetase beta chain